MEPIADVADSEFVEKVVEMVPVQDAVLSLGGRPPVVSQRWLELSVDGTFDPSCTFSSPDGEFMVEPVWNAGGGVAATHETACPERNWQEVSTALWLHLLR